MDYAMVWRIILTKVALWLKYKVPNKVRLSLNKYNLKNFCAYLSYMKKDSKTTKIELNEQTLVAALTKSNNVVMYLQTLTLTDDECFVDLISRENNSFYLEVT